MILFADNIIERTVALMEKSLSELATVVSSHFEKNLIYALENSEDVSLLVMNVQEYLNEIGAVTIAKLLEEINQIVKESSERNRDWELHKSFSETILNTIFGEGHYSRTYYRTKENPKDYAFLSDLILGIESHDKTDLLLDARMIEESIDLAYRKSGEKGILPLTFSGQMVMNKIRKLMPSFNLQMDAGVLLR